MKKRNNSILKWPIYTDLHNFLPRQRWASSTSSLSPSLKTVSRWISRAKLRSKLNDCIRWNSFDLRANPLLLIDFVSNLKRTQTISRSFAGKGSEDAPHLTRNGTQATKCWSGRDKAEMEMWDIYLMLLMRETRSSLWDDACPRHKFQK